MAPLISLSLKYSILQLLYRVLLPKLRVMCNFLIVMNIAHQAVGGLGLGSIEMEEVVEALYLIISMKLSTPSALLLTESLELL